MRSPIIISTLTLSAALAAPSVAHAGLDACSDIHVRSDAQCEFVAEGCEVECTPLAVEAACAAELQAECSGTCDASASVDCEVGCQASCETQCTIDPGSFDCQAGCQADCDASCAARCDSDDSECWATCEATCSTECTASCEVVPPDAECVAQCQACCGGSCQAEANLDCQIDCQADTFVECKADLQGGCEADCSEAGAALFCDGQWVDVGYDADACVAALEDLLDGEVSGQAQFECRPGECSFDSSGFLSCSVDGDDRGSRGAAWAATLFMIGFGALRRRRRPAILRRDGGSKRADPA